MTSINICLLGKRGKSAEKSKKLILKTKFKVKNANIMKINNFLMRIVQFSK